MKERGGGEREGEREGKSEGGKRWREEREGVKRGERWQLRVWEERVREIERVREEKGKKVKRNTISLSVTLFPN